MPTFRKRNIHNSFRFPEPNQIELDNRRIKLPKLGWIGFHKSQPILGKLRNVTISKDGTHWVVSIQVEQQISTKANGSTTAIGIDLGITKFAAFSDGSHIDGPSSFKKHQDKLAKEQRKLAKKIKFSSNWKKQKAKITKLHSRIAHVRKDFLHKSSTEICKSHAMIVVEDLKINNMSKSAKGTIEAPGKNVKAKSGLNRSILDQGWGEFRRQLEYKSKWLGGVFVKVPPKDTSLTCHRCKHKDKQNRLTQEGFACTCCGYTANADFNAACNILAAGHAVLACGEGALAPFVKQEPLRNRERLVA